jgi:hypothetical protein
MKAVFDTDNYYDWRWGFLALSVLKFMFMSRLNKQNPFSCAH